MAWLVDLFLKDSIAHALLILSLVTAFGLGIGNIRIFGISLGIAGVLFSGLIFGHFNITINHEVMEFAREFGLILFVFSIGLEVGPGFLASLRKQGLPLNIMAASVVLLGAIITILINIFGKVSMPVAVGLFSGGTTNTPSLAAAQQALKQLPGIDEATTQLPGLGYAIAYPFGVIGIILVMLAVRYAFRIDPAEEAQVIEKLKSKDRAPLSTINLEVNNPNLDGVPIRKIPTISTSGVVVSRLSHDGTIVEIPRADTTVQLGDILHVVGPPEQLEELKMIVGTESRIDLKTLPGTLTTKRILVTEREALGQSIQELNVLESHGVIITRLIRTGVEFTPRPDFRLQFGDVLTAVGEEEAINQVAKVLGNSPQELNHPHIIPIFVGIALGVILGSYPMHIGGLPAPVKLGLAGGPLLVAIILSRIGRIGSLIWYVPINANLMLRHIGISLFLACVGLKSGDRFVETLLGGQGLYWMLLAALITVVPLIIVALVARMIYKLNFMSLCGLLAGSMTDPPALAFANSIATSDAPSISYVTVYPLVMLLRVFSAQILVSLFLR
jgi:putative transport protein